MLSLKTLDTPPTEQLGESFTLEIDSINEGLEAPQRRWYHRPLQWGSAALALATTVGCVVLRVFIKNNPVVSTLASTGAGVAAQVALEVSFPKKVLHVLHHLQMKNAFVLYFILTQVYLNLPDESVEKEIVLSLLAAIGGTWITLKVESVVRRKLVNTIEEEPLLDPQHRTLFLEPNTKTAFLTYQISKTALGSAMIVTSQLGYDWHDTLFNSGMYMIGHATGVTVETVLSYMKENIRSKNEIAIQEGSIPLSLRSINVIERTIDTFGNHGWGMLFVLNRPESYLAIGSLIGFIKMTAKRRFEVENIQPSEFRKSMLKIDRWMNALVAVGFTSWLTTLIVIDSDLVDRVALGSLGAGAVAGFALRTFLNRKREEESSILNTLDFYTGLHPVIWILPFSYLWEQMEIGDIALENASAETLALASTAWASFGSSFAIDQAFPFSQFSPIVDSLYGNFYVWAARGQA